MAKSNTLKPATPAMVREALRIADDDAVVVIEGNAYLADKEGWTPIGHRDAGAEGREAKDNSELDLYVRRSIRWAQRRGLAEVKTRPLRVRLK